MFFPSLAINIRITLALLQRSFSFSHQAACDAIEEGRETFIICGSKVFTEAMEMVDRIYATEVYVKQWIYTNNLNNIQKMCETVLL